MPLKPATTRVCSETKQNKKMNEMIMMIINKNTKMITNNSITPRYLFKTKNKNIKYSETKKNKFINHHKF